VQGQLERGNPLLKTLNRSLKIGANTRRFVLKSKANQNVEKKKKEEKEVLSNMRGEEISGRARTEVVSAATGENGKSLTPLS